MTTSLAKFAISEAITERIFSLSPRSTVLPLSKKLDPFVSTSSMRSPSVVTANSIWFLSCAKPGSFDRPR